MGGLALMECPCCHRKVTRRDVRQRRCPTCGSKISWSDEWRWSRGIGTGLLALLVVSHWFPRELDIGRTLLWVGLWWVTAHALFVASVFALPPKVDLVPGRGPVRLDI